MNVSFLLLKHPVSQLCCSLGRWLESQVLGSRKKTSNTSTELCNCLLLHILSVLNFTLMWVSFLLHLIQWLVIDVAWNRNVGLFCWKEKSNLDDYWFWILNKNEQICLQICDPIQQKVHLVGQVYSEIMHRIECKI